MARIGAFCFPGTGHINPMTALARRLQKRGHSVVIFGIADVEPRVKAAGIEFCQLGRSDFPLGTLQALDQRQGELEGLACFKFTMDRVKNTAHMILRDGPEAVRRANVEVMLVDIADVGGTVAEYLGLPFVSFSVIPPLDRDNRIPPFCFGWPARQDLLSRLRNEVAFLVLKPMVMPIAAVVNRQRAAWQMKPMKDLDDVLSKLAQITQLPEALEFDVELRNPLVRYTGPLVDAEQRPKVDFDWDRLDGRPLVYASLGTLQNGSEEAFRTIANACADLPVQLVISLGGGLEPQQLGTLRGDPIVVKYAPQLELIKRAEAVITHAGLNTVLESLAEGVPLVCIPMGNDQPGVAARVAAKGAGTVVPRRKLQPKRLQSAVRAVLEHESYRRAARELQASLQQFDSLELAADIVENALKIRKEARQTSPVPGPKPGNLKSVSPALQTLD